MKYLKDVFLWFNLVPELFILHCVQKKTATFLYISMENRQIFTKFSGNV